MALSGEIGKKGEQIARDYFLQHSHFHILHQNWRHARQEIDFIVQSQGTIIFIEVKTRSSDQFGYPEAAVDPRKQAHLQSAATAYLEKMDASPEAIRFDVIAIVLHTNESFELQHFVDAF
ncbi:putative endonuclease [Chitinophaga skermanii]|uniref:UPF0102 protein LX64_01797 n=1 Tax=Chitinophaga skermanii TaxID=331697 RepID=A0A327QQQ8_9BACT|nr:YraN family protein [Chitinophaga skermanii]RAJ06670.1 putative endonuclease [Chitinophaga skermanii]